MKISLTGIKPTGQPHLGNYLGAIKSALSLIDDYKAYYFIADYHALNSINNGEVLQNYTYEVCATWLACGLDSSRELLYRQSDIPEIFELNSFLMNFVAKGLMNRAHAYKVMSQENLANNKDLDYQINMGLYTYPILMAADILLFDTAIVPVGQDQVQHVEYAADIAQRVNHIYNAKILTIPQAKITNEEVILGIDGRKMSKSYNNVIPLFLEKKKLRKIIMKILTNSQKVDEIKDPDTCNIFSLYRHFSTLQEQDDLAQRYSVGRLGWGDVKQHLFEKIENYFEPKRDIYFDLLNNRQYLDEILQEGAKKARVIAKKTMDRVRKISGISHSF